MKYAITQTTTVEKLLHGPLESKKKRTDSKIRMFDMDPRYAKLASEVMQTNLNSGRVGAQQQQHSIGGSDYSNSSTADAENA